MPANLKIQLKPSMSEIRNYLVANPIIFPPKDKLSNKIVKSNGVKEKRELKSSSTGWKNTTVYREYPVNIQQVCITFFYLNVVCVA